MINIIFMIINFLVLLGLGVIIFNKKIKHLLHKQMQAEQAQKNNEYVHYDEMLKTKAQLAQDLVEQAEIIKNLTSNIERWNTAFHRQKEQIKQQNNSLYEQRLKRRQLQVRYYEQHALREQLVPAVIQEAEQKLYTFFESPQAQENYVKFVCTLSKGKR